MKCPKCKKEMIMDFFNTTVGHEHICCNNPKCWFYGISRKTKEELIKQRDQAAADEKTRAEAAAEEAKQLHSNGLLTRSDKTNLGTKEISRQIKEKLNKEFPNCVFSVTIRFRGIDRR
jgi:ssDNA-binding Zn-finger/Zn-ribbon topoisomerase 1